MPYFDKGQCVNIICTHHAVFLALGILKPGIDLAYSFNLVEQEGGLK